MNTEVIKKKFSDGSYDDLLLDIYQDSSLIDYQRDRYVKAVEKFEELYGAGEAVVLSVPGRSEVGGNHTDHQHGKVLACAINLDIIAVVRKSEDVDIVSDERIVRFSVRDLNYRRKEEKSTKALVKGVIKRLHDLGYVIGGFEGYLTSDVLVGSGMSSSAAFEVMIGNIISQLYNLGQISDVEIAKASQVAENVYFGKPSGLMDQMACSVGNLINIDFADQDNPVLRKVDVDFSKAGYSLCIVDTKGSHAHLTDEYASIPTEMKKVAEFFGKNYVSELDYQQIFDNIAALREQCGDRAVLRAVHVLQENRRVDQQVDALQKGDFKGFLNLVRESGNSSYRYLQNVYANSDCQNQGISIGLMFSELILKDNGVCRVHGGGFAGSIQAFVRDAFVSEYKQQIEKVFGKDSCHVLKIRKYGGKLVIK